MHPISSIVKAAICELSCAQLSCNSVAKQFHPHSRYFERHEKSRTFRPQTIKALERIITTNGMLVCVYWLDACRGLLPPQSHRRQSALLVKRGAIVQPFTENGKGSATRKEVEAGGTNAYSVKFVFLSRMECASTRGEGFIMVCIYLPLVVARTVALVVY